MQNSTLYPSNTIRDNYDMYGEVCHTIAQLYPLKLQFYMSRDIRIAKAQTPFTTGKTKHRVQSAGYCVPHHHMHTQTPTKSYHTKGYLHLQINGVTIFHESQEHLWHAATIANYHEYMQKKHNWMITDCKKTGYPLNMPYARYPPMIKQPSTFWGMTSKTTLVLKSM